MDYSKELSPEVREKMKKNLVYVGIFAVVMFFAGLTSAYYVNMGGGFWLKYPMPTGFYLSTLFIGISSLCYILAIRYIKQGKLNAMKLLMSLPLFHKTKTGLHLGSKDRRRGNRHLLLGIPLCGNGLGSHKSRRSLLT